MFWGLVLLPNRRYAKRIVQDVHLSQASIDIKNSSNEPICITLSSCNREHILCTLRKNEVEQVALNLNLSKGDRVTFGVKGDANVHLTGYLLKEKKLKIRPLERLAKVIEKYDKAKHNKSENIRESSDCSKADEDIRGSVENGHERDTKRSDEKGYKRSGMGNDKKNDERNAERTDYESEGESDGTSEEETDETNDETDDEEGDIGSDDTNDDASGLEGDEVRDERSSERDDERSADTNDEESCEYRSEESEESDDESYRPVTIRQKFDNDKRNDTDYKEKYTQTLCQPY